MYLKSLEISGFKSFAKKNSFEFNTPVSAIVGPNGSGKSNVAEAFRFVLGEQSIKNMRGKRGEDLIWNGGGSEPRSNRASVKVIFDNSQKIFDLDFPEVSIERVVHRDGLNEYKINNSPARLKDILELLAGAHIGASGHHIISQGEADRILSANTKDRKGMIEDTLGLKIYQYKRQESERKLKKTFENIAQVESLRREIAPHLKFLKKQVEKIEKTENLRQELQTFAKDYFKRENFYLQKTKEILVSERKPLEETQVKLEKELSSAKKTLEKSSEREKKNSILLSMEGELGSSRRERDKLQRELGKLEGSIVVEERVIAREKELLANDENKTVRLKDVEDLVSEIEREKEDENLFARIKKILTDFIKREKESSHSSTIEESERNINKLKGEKIEVEDKLEKIAAEETKVSQRLEDLKKEIELEKDSNYSAEKAILRIMSEENEILSKINMINLREERLASDKEEFDRVLKELSFLVGAEILRFGSPEKNEEEEFLSEERKIQEERRRALEKFKIRFEDANVSGMADIKKEYDETSERDEFLAKELLDLEKSAVTLKNLIEELENRLSTEFSTGISRINEEFGKLFSKMFGGGEASLSLVKEKKNLPPGVEEEFESDEEETVEEGLEIKVNLPRKKIRNLMMLSGGERALTSIALIFAMASVNPPPFIILDETDAALDESNSKKYGDLVEILSKHSQLILITHNRETMSRAGIIYGVTMGSSGVSKLLSISFAEAVEVAK